MKKIKWDIVHECDMGDGTPTQWVAEINHPTYGSYVWINDIGFGLTAKGFNVEVDYDGFVELVQCKSLASAKRWVAMNLLN